MRTVSETSKKEQEKITTLKRNEMVTIARKLPPLRISRIISGIRLRHALFLPPKRKISPSRQFVWELHFLHTIDSMASLWRRIFPAAKNISVSAHANAASFRPSIQSTAQSGVGSNVDSPASISGLQFCLNMVIFAAPGVVLAKRLCDGESVEDIIQHTDASLNSFMDRIA